MNSQTETCGQCRYFDRTSNASGYCLVNPPTVNETDEGRYINDPSVSPNRPACRFFVEGGE